MTLPSNLEDRLALTLEEHRILGRELIAMDQTLSRVLDLIRKKVTSRHGRSWDAAAMLLRVRPLINLARHNLEDTCEVEHLLDFSNSIYFPDRATMPPTYRQMFPESAARIEQAIKKEKENRHAALN